MTVFFQTDHIVTQSFIGGLYLDQGLDAVREWLYPLFRPYAKAAYLIVREQHGLRPSPPLESDLGDLTAATTTTAMNSTTTPGGHLALFNQHLQKSNCLVEWIYSDSITEANLTNLKVSRTTPMWHMKVMVDEEHYGEGKGSTKNAARNEAAKMGLEKMGIFVW